MIERTLFMLFGPNTVIKIHAIFILEDQKSRRFDGQKGNDRKRTHALLTDIKLV